MAGERANNSGISLCIEAFQRLVEGSPVVSDHVGLPRTKITAGIVSVEAGFDRGYLKKARAQHRSLIAQIEAFRNTSAAREIAPSSHKIKQAERRYRQLCDENQRIRSVRDAVLAQNIQLYERVRELEALLSRAGVKLT